MNVSLDHGGVDAHFASFGDTLLVRDAHDSVVDLFDAIWSESQAPAAHGLGIRHFGEAYAGEVAVDQVGTHLTLEHVIAPIAHVFQDQQTQHYFRRETAPAACAAQVMALAQSFI